MMAHSSKLRKKVFAKRSAFLCAFSSVLSENADSVRLLKEASRNALCCCLSPGESFKKESASSKPFDSDSNFTKRAIALGCGIVAQLTVVI